MMAFSSTMSTVRVHATRRAHGWAYFRSREMGSIARARRRRCRAHGWMDGWMDGWMGWRLGFEGLTMRRLWIRARVVRCDDAFAMTDA